MDIREVPILEYSGPGIFELTNLGQIFRWMTQPLPDVAARLNFMHSRVIISVQEALSFCLAGSLVDFRFINTPHKEPP